MSTKDYTSIVLTMAKDNVVRKYGSTRVLTWSAQTWWSSVYEELAYINVLPVSEVMRIIYAHYTD